MEGGEVEEKRWAEGGDFVLGDGQRVDGEGGHGSSHVARVDASNSLAVAIISSQLMSRLAAALLRRVLHLEPVAVLLVEAGEVGNRRVLGGGVRGWAHSSSWEGFGV